MLREPCSWRKQDSSDLFNGLPGSLSDNLRGTSLLSQPSCLASGESLKESGHPGPFNIDGGIDHAIMTMQTRVAIRDENPHRFQVVPLRDVSKLDTSSAGHRENASRPSISTPPKHKTIWQPRPKLRVNYQPNSLSSPPSVKSHLEHYAKENTVSCDRPTLGTNSNKENAFVLSIDTVPPHSEKSASTLAQIDINQPEWRRPVTSSAADASTAVSIQKLIHSESPLTHTVSRSLQIRTRPERNYHRFASTGHVQPPAMPLLVGKPKPKIRSRALSDATLLNCRVEGLDPDDESYYALLDAYDSDAMDAKLKKRHAIYSSSLYFDPPSQVRGSRKSSSSNTREITYASLQALSGSSVGAQLNADILWPNSDTGLRQRAFDGNVGHGQAFPTINRDSTTTGSMVLLPTNYPATQHLRHKSSSHSLRIHKLSGGLKRPKLTREQRNLLSAQEVVYPQIILDLLSDTDEAIAEWNGF